MAYLVELTARAARDLEDLYMEKKAAESQAAANWRVAYIRPFLANVGMQ